MTDLQECRRKIDEIDNQMVELFEKRMKVCEEVAEYKIHTGKKVLDPEQKASVSASHRVWSERRGKLPNGGAASQK